MWGVLGPPHGGAHEHRPPTDVSSPPDAPTEAPSGPTGGRRPRRLPNPLAVAAVSLAVAMLIVTVGVQLAGSGTPDVREVLEPDTTTSATAPEGGASGPDVGETAPEVTLDWLGGGTARLSSLRGAPLLVNFWSSTCAPCREEMPAFEAVHRSAADDSVRVLGIDVTDTEAAGLEMVERTGVTYRNARDPQGEIMAAFGGTALPRTVLLDAEGRVLAAHSGALTGAELRSLLAENGITT